ncbi:hypothetical protein GE09DRAFT_455006 [Coniochaeta sp. 2T2.1]|nr:hypothetical protein GE09DRAFT_455006 [Coniochaeta sp. 2T2.1]
MCQRATCTKCHKLSWWGCGKHVPRVLERIDASKRCSCEPTITRDNRSYPPMAEDPGWLIRGLADTVLRTRGKQAAYSAEGVIEVDRHSNH